MRRGSLWKTNSQFSLEPLGMWWRYPVIIYMKKLLDSDWLRAVQFTCNTRVKTITPMQITPRISGIKKIGNYLSQRYHVKWWRTFCTETLKIVFSKMVSRKILRHFFQGKFFRAYTWIIRFPSFNLEFICTCEFLKKLKLHEPLQLFEKLTRAN